jgi:hypothetical protein
MLSLHVSAFEVHGKEQPLWFYTTKAPFFFQDQTQEQAGALRLGTRHIDRGNSLAEKTNKKERVLAIFCPSPKKLPALVVYKTKGSRKAHVSASAQKQIPPLKRRTS